MHLENGSKLLFIGDSITDCQRTRPVGYRNGGGLGNGYVAMVDAALSLDFPGSDIRVANLGTNGHRICDLSDRWQTDVFDLTPDWLVVNIGINDVWRQFDRKLHFDESDMDMAAFEATYRDLLERTRGRLKGLVLMTPFYLETNRKDPMRARVDEYGQIVSLLSKEYDALFIDTQKVFDDCLEKIATQLLSDDRVHPNTTGHLVLARAFVETVAS